MTDLDTLLNSMSSKFNETEAVDLNLNDDKTLKWRGLFNNKSATFGRRRDGHASTIITKKEPGDGEVSSSISSSLPSSSLAAATSGTEKLLGGNESHQNETTLNSDIDIKLLPKAEEFPSDKKLLSAEIPTEQQQQARQLLPSSPLLTSTQQTIHKHTLNSSSPNNVTAATCTLDNENDDNTHSTPTKELLSTTTNTFDKPKRILRRKTHIEQISVVVDKRITKRNKSKESNADDEQIKVLESPVQQKNEATAIRAKTPIEKIENELITTPPPKRRGRTRKQPVQDTETSQEANKTEEIQQKTEEIKSSQSNKLQETEPKSLRLRRSERTQTPIEHIQVEDAKFNDIEIIDEQMEEKLILNSEPESSANKKKSDTESPKRKRKTDVDVEIEKENIKESNETIPEIIEMNLEPIKLENNSPPEVVTAEEQMEIPSQKEIKIPKKRGRKPGKKLIDLSMIKKSPRISKDNNDVYTFGKKDKTTEQVSYINLTFSTLQSFFFSSDSAAITAFVTSH